MMTHVFFLITSLSLSLPIAADAIRTPLEQKLPQAYSIETLCDLLPDNSQIRALTTRLIHEWEAYKASGNKNFEIDALILAIIYGAEKHHGQKRKDAAGTPYIIHPLQVCYNLWDIGQVRNSNILISSILHDSLEDTDATESEIEKYFGKRVCETIKEVSNDPNLDTNANKQRQIDHVPLMSQDARLLKLADRLANIVDLRTPPPSWNTEKVDGYFTWGEKLLTALRGTNANLEAALEKEIKNHQDAKATSLCPITEQS